MRDRRAGYGAGWGGQREHGGMYGGGREDRQWGRDYDRYAPRGPHYGKGPKGYRRSDERIRDDACDTISRQGMVDASDVEVKVEDGVVVLTGTVRERKDKRMLEQMVERLHGVEDVRNELRLQRADQARTQAPPSAREVPRSPSSNGRSVPA